MKFEKLSHKDLVFYSLPKICFLQFTFFQVVFSLFHKTIWFFDAANIIFSFLWWSILAWKYLLYCAIPIIRKSFFLQLSLVFLKQHKLNFLATPYMQNLLCSYLKK